MSGASGTPPNLNAVLYLAEDPEPIPITVSTHQLILRARKAIHTWDEEAFTTSKIRAPVAIPQEVEQLLTLHSCKSCHPESLIFSSIWPAAAPGTCPVEALGAVARVELRVRRFRCSASLLLRRRACVSLHWLDKPLRYPVRFRHTRFRIPDIRPTQRTKRLLYVRRQGEETHHQPRPSTWATLNQHSSISDPSSSWTHRDSHA